MEEQISRAAGRINKEARLSACHPLCLQRGAVGISAGRTAEGEITLGSRYLIGEDAERRMSEHLRMAGVEHYHSSWTILKIARVLWISSGFSTNSCCKLSSEDVADSTGSTWRAVSLAERGWRAAIC